MAGDVPTPDDPNKIDISLSLLSGQSGLAFEKFVQELEGLRKGIEALTKFTPDVAARAARSMAEFYTSAEGRTAGLSSSASRATRFNPDGSTTIPVTQPQAVQEDIQTVQRETAQREADRFEKAKDARTALGEGLNTIRTSGLGQGFNQYVRGAYRRRPLDLGAATGYTTHDEEEADAGGAPPDHGGAGIGAGREKDWWQRRSEAMANAPLKIPRAGHFTAEDVLNTAAQWVSNKAQKSRENAAINAGAQTRDQFDDSEAGYQAYQQNLQDNLGGEAGTNTGDTLGNVGALMYRAAHKWAPQAALVKQYYDRYVGITPGDLLTSGYEQGYSGQSGDINIGPFGVRTPFSAAGIAGIKTEAQNFTNSMSAGINREQAASIQAATINSGRNINDPQHDQFLNVLKNLTKWNPTIGQNSSTAEMLDKVMRYGGETSLQRFVETMKQIPDAANAAHVHVNQMVQDMAAMGDFNREQGGTFYGGMQAAQNFALSTGLPAALLPGLSQNKFVQAQSFLETGFAPWQQGLMSPTQRTQSSVDSVLRMAPMVAGYSHAVAGKKDKYGFTSGGATAQQMEAANLHMLFPELPTSAISDMLKNGKQMNAQSQLITDARGVSHAVKGDQAWEKTYGAYRGAVAGLHSGDPVAMSEGAKWLKDHPWAASHGGVLQKNATNASSDIQKLLAGHGQRSWAALEKEMSGAGFSQKEIKAVRDAGKLPPMMMTGSAQINATKIAQARQHKLEGIVAKHSGKFGNDLNGPKITIELGKAAAKHFQLQMDPASQAKLAAGAGQGSVNDPYGTGPTAITDPYGG